MLDARSAELVAEMEANFQRAKERAARRARATLTEDIGPGLGQVVVSGYGRLVSITIDRDAFQVVNEDTLAGKVVEAVTRAEKKARTEGEQER